MKYKFLVLGYLFLLMFSFISASITGDGITGIVKEEEIPSQLFDITFSIEEALILSSSDLISVTTFTSFGSETTPAELTYVIVNEQGETVHIEKEYIEVETEQVIRKDFSHVDLAPGKYSLYLKTLYNEDVADTFLKKFEIRTKISKSLGQLFDIRMDLSSNKIIAGGDISSVVTFTSFGSEPTPVNLNFKILDASGKEIYNADDNIVVETEAVYTKSFKNLGLEEGYYSVVLTTFYNVDVEDEFTSQLRVISQGFSYSMAFWISLLANLFLVYFVAKRYSRKK